MVDQPGFRSAGDLDLASEARSWGYKSTVLISPTGSNSSMQLTCWAALVS